MGSTQLIMGPSPSSITMRTSTIVFVASIILTVSSQGPPRVRRLHRMDTQDTDLNCSLDELLKCQEEITKAVEDCEHISDWTDVASIMTCIKDILATKDCQKCICDVIPVVCP